MPEPKPTMTESLAETDPREIDQRLRHVARQETVGRLAAGFAHELGTPLNVVLGRARMISRGQVEGAAAVESADIIVQQALRMTELVRGLLTFARSRPSPTGRVVLGRLLDASCRLLHPIAHKRHVRFEVDGSDVELAIVGDTSALEQVLANIVMNALDVMPRGGVIRLSLDTREGRGPDGGEQALWHGIRVTDGGPGIPEALRERVFEPFFTTKDVGTGTGLGLSVAYGIVRDHAGWIEIGDADPAPGASVTVWLPAAD